MSTVAGPSLKPPAAERSNAVAWRRERYAARDTLWDESSLERVRKCGHTAVQSRGVAVRLSGTGPSAVAGYSGLSTCGSVWACPVCAHKILSGRQKEIESGLAVWTAGGGRVGLVTLTMRHRKGQSLGKLWDGLSKAWAAVTSGREWLRQQETYGSPLARTVTKGKRKGQVVVENRVPWIRVVEVTHGENGWHVHVHAAMLLPTWADAKSVDALGSDMFDRWAGALVANGLLAPIKRRGGLDAQLWDGKAGVLSNYFTKNEYAATVGKTATELVRSDFKEGRRGNRTPFQILRDVVELGCGDSLELWHEYEAASKGRRQCTWSAGLKDRLGVAEVEDQELAEEDHGGDEVMLLPGDTWRALRKARETCWLLELVELGVDAAGAMLDDRGLIWHRPPPPDRE